VPRATVQVKEEMEVLRMADAPGAEIDVYVYRHPQSLPITRILY
jgi:hypothetical protein